MPFGPIGEVLILTTVPWPAIGKKTLKPRTMGIDPPAIIGVDAILNRESRRQPKGMIQVTLPIWLTHLKTICSAVPRSN